MKRTAFLVTVGAGLLVMVLGGARDVNGQERESATAAALRSLQAEHAQLKATLAERDKTIRVLEDEIVVLKQTVERLKTGGGETKADLERQIIDVQARVNQGQSKVMALTRTTIDVRIPPPPGSAYQGSAGLATQYGLNDRVKRGDFRTQKDKDKAIADAKAALLPLYEELRALKQKLADIQPRPQPSPGTSP